MNVDQAGPQSTTYQEAIDFLYGRINYEKIGHTTYSAANYRLDRMRRLLELIGNPQSRYRILHVAGTKGKGTTSIVAAHLLSNCGFRVGLFSSPHLLRLEERIQCDGVPCTAETLIGLVDRVRHAAELLEREGGGRPTFFEMTTAMGMLHFAEFGCDIAVLEVGLGGRLDSTNVCQPDVAIITSISFDHQAQLGNTITSIANEKAGIIKSQIPVVCSARDLEARQVIEQKAKNLDAPFYLIDRDFSVQWERCLPPATATPDSSRPIFAKIHYQPKFAPSVIGNSTWKLPILGRHQADNVAAALTAIDLLFSSLTSQPPAPDKLAACANLQPAFSTLQLPARLQPVASAPVQLIDTAHNPASISATLDALDDHFPSQERTIVFASSRDKEFAKMLRLLILRCQRLVLTAYQNNPRALALPDLVDAANRISIECLEEESKLAPSKTAPTPLGKILYADHPAAAWELALQDTNSSSIICGTGSFFLAAELLPLFDTSGGRLQ